MNKNKEFNAGIYIRLSREDEKEKESSSIVSQRELLLSFLNKNQFHYVAEYVDDGFTGTNFDRPGFQKMIKDIEKGIINMVVVKDLSRLGRNNSKVAYYLDEYFPIYRVRFIAINNDYDSFIPSVSKEYAWLANGMNESYCLDISKKVRSALKSRKEKGYFTGWKAPYGYKRSKENYHKLIIDDKVSPIVQRIFMMAYHGKSASQIADILSNEKIPNPSNYAHLNRNKTSKSYSLWCARTISEMLTNETYIGNITQGRRTKINYKLKKQTRVPKEEWIIVENTHEAIVDQTIFHTVQNLLKKTRKTNGTNDKLLKGFLYCRECGHSIGITKSSDGKRYYLGCTYYRKYSKHKVCTPHTMNYQVLENLILDKLRDVIKASLNKEQLLQKLYNQNINNRKKQKIQNQIKQEIQKITVSSKAIDRAYIDMIKQCISSEKYKTIITELEDEIVLYKKNLMQLEGQLSKFKNEDYYQAERNRLEQIIKLKSPSRALLASLIDKIYITENKKVEIYFKFKNISLKV